MELHLDKRSVKQILRATQDAIEEGDNESLREDILAVFTEEQVDEIEKRIDTDFFEFVSDLLDEWSGDEVEELFELLEAQLSDVGVDLKYEKVAKAASDADEEDEEEEDDEEEFNCFQNYFVILNMNVNSNNKSTTEQIVEVVQALSSEQQKMLLIQLKKNEILEKAKKLDKINKAKNLKISMKEICSIVNEVRDGKNVVR